MKFLHLTDESDADITRAAHENIDILEPLHRNVPLDGQITLILEKMSVSLAFHWMGYCSALFARFKKTLFWNVILRNIGIEDGQLSRMVSRMDFTQSDCDTYLPECFDPLQHKLLHYLDTVEVNNPLSAAEIEQLKSVEGEYSDGVKEITGYLET